MFNPTQLRYALALRQHRHFGNAAKALGVSQPALSRAIGSLEQSLGLSLFDRDRGGVWPTEVGVRLLDSARHLMLDIEDFEREAELLRDIESHTLRLSLGPYPAILSGHRAIGELMHAMPELCCRVRTDRWFRTTQVLIAREADLALAELSDAVLNDDRLLAEPVSRSRVVICCRVGHPLLDAESHSIDALLEYPWVSTRLPKRVAGILKAERVRAGTTDKTTGEFIPSLEIENLDQIGPLVARSNGLGIVTLSMIERELDEGLLRPLPYHPEWLRLNYGFVRARRRTLSPTSLKYMELVRRVEQDISAREIVLRRRFECPIDLDPEVVAAPTTGATGNA